MNPRSFPECGNSFRGDSKHSHARKFGIQRLLQALLKGAGIGPALGFANHAVQVLGVADLKPSRLPWHPPLPRAAHRHRGAKG